jgi:hypothetical protein
VRRRRRLRPPGSSSARFLKGSGLTCRRAALPPPAAARWPAIRGQDISNRPSIPLFTSALPADPTSSREPHIDSLGARLNINGFCAEYLVPFYDNK